MKRGRKGQLAIRGGKPVREEAFPSWPQFDEKEEDNLLEVLRSGKWGRHQGNQVSKFEQRFAELCEVKQALAVSSGSTALEIALRSAGVEAGHEVLVPPYTFMSTIMSVLIVNALPVFVDIDPDTYCMDPQKVEEQITPYTKALLPVHLAGMPCDMGPIKDIAGKHDIPVIEDACQAHLAEWEGEKVGGIGDIGCFSFQTSKNISSGEGGAIVSDDPSMMKYCFHYHTCGRPKESESKGELWYSHDYLGSNYRMTEFQAAILLAQLDRIKGQIALRENNASYLTEHLSQIQGIEPLTVPEFVTTHAYHLYIFRYRAEKFDGLHRDTFIKALRAEGIPCSPGYPQLYKEGFLEKAVKSRTFKKIFGKERLNDYFSNIHCPVNDKACKKEAVWLPQPVLLGNQADLKDIIEAISKIRRNSGELN